MSGEVKALTAMARKMVKMERDIATAEAKLKKQKADHRQLSERDLPEAMDDAGVEELALANGWKLTLSDKIHVKITDDNAEDAHTWLRDNGLGAVVKRTLTVVFPTGKEKKSAHLFRYLAARKYLVDADIVSVEKVHAGTLKKTMRDALADGMDVPMDTFGVFEHRVATAKAPKSKRAKA